MKRSEQQFDIHLSAEAIDVHTIEAIERAGFKEDFFKNNRNSKPPHYHASFRTHLDKPDDVLWEQTVALLKGDPTFKGCLEEESFSEDWRCVFDTRGELCRTGVILEPFVLEVCRPGEHKMCDIHINVDLCATESTALEKMEAFNFISFERKVNDKECRIYSLTFNQVSEGRKVFCRLSQIFLSIPGLLGKMKLEEVTRFMVCPDDAGQLPITRGENVSAWLANSV